LQITVITTKALRQRAMGFSLLALLLTGCGRAPAETLPEVSSHRECLLNLISPLESTQVSGGQDLRITLYLVDQNGLPVEGATVQAELWTPSGKRFASLPCTDRGEGRYLSEYASLSLRGASGTWHVIGKATWDDGQQAEVEGTLQVKPSISEMYQDRYGFWIEHPRIFGLGTGFYNLSESGGLHFEDWLNEDGSGYVILDNYRYNTIGVTFAALEVHWRHVAFPADGAVAIAYAQSLAGSGLHHQDPDTPLTDLAAKTVTFQGRPAWQVLGRGSEYYVSKAANEYPVEWLMFHCPGSDWLWSLVVSTDHEDYMNHLRAVQETFECPPVNWR
jgi:hypothetical protein